MVAAAVQETVLLAEGAIKLSSISDETGSLSGGCVFLNTVQSVHGLYTSFAFYSGLDRSFEGAGTGALLALVLRAQGSRRNA